MSMDYADLEKQDIQKQRQKAEENLFIFGNGLGQLVWDTESLVKVIVGIIASLSLAVSLFIAKSGNAVMDSGLWILAISFVLILFGYIYQLLTRKENTVFMIDNKTAIYISHRLSSCRFCDDITVFDGGRIVQKGKHEELVKERDGQYFRLWNTQAQYYQSN